MFATITVEREDREIEVEILGAYHRGARGSRDRYGAPLEPDEPARIEILEVGGGIVLTDEETEEAVEALIAARNDDFDPPYDES